MGEMVEVLHPPAPRTNNSRGRILEAVGMNSTGVNDQRGAQVVSRSAGVDCFKSRVRRETRLSFAPK